MATASGGPLVGQRTGFFLWLGGWTDAWIDEAEVLGGWQEFWEEWCFQQHAQRWLDPQ